MNAAGFSIDNLLRMAHSSVRNYVVPGLTSSLIGQPSKHGTVRLFSCERDQQEAITPHSHRFDFQCWVLRGEVRNRIWSPAAGRDSDTYTTTSLRYEGDIGRYSKAPGEIGRWTYKDSVFRVGECYAMRAHEVHSIFFSRHALVLFFEGPAASDTSIVLEPLVGDETIPTLEVQPWMFQKATGEGA